jgi:hypothetical protein
MRHRRLIGVGTVGAVPAVTAVAVLAVASALAAGIYAGPGHTSATDKTAAHADGAMLLNSIELPAGATVSSTEPAGGGRYLAEPATRPVSTNLVDQHRWWTIAVGADSVLAYLHSHVPAGAKLDGTSTLSGPNVPTVRSVQYDWPLRANVLGQRSLVVEVMALPAGLTGVRADAQDLWITPRPQSERIPAGVDRVRVSVTTGGKTTQGPYVLSSHQRVRAAARVIDSLPLFPPGVFSCPADFGIAVKLEFYDGASTAPVAVANDDPSGCPGVQLTIDGHGQPALAADTPGVKTPVTARLERALGLHLDTRPPG